MPELPTVEIFKEFFESTSLKQEIQRVEINNPEILIDTTAGKLKDTLQGQEFSGGKRYGKYLFCRLENGYFLTFHFGMNGFLKYFQKECVPYTRLLLEFKSGYKLVFQDSRKFGKVWLIRDPEKFLQEKNLGPDALEIDWKTFKERVKKRKGSLKPLLMNQSFLAGIGNLYADEILYQSGVHPLSRADKLDKNRVHTLFKEMKRVLNKAIQYRDKTDLLPSSFLLPHRHLNGQCPQGGDLKIIKVSGRTTYFCPEHQEFFG